MKYYTPERVEKLVTELEKVIDDFSFLDTCKESGHQCGKYLDTLLEDSLAHLADKCEIFIDDFDFYLKNK